MRVLVVSNMESSRDAPQRGSFVRDQVRALRGLGVEVESFDWLPGSRGYPAATRRLRRLIREGRFDLVHAHYGLAGWCAALAGAPRLVVTFHGTDVRHPAVGRLSRLLARRPILVAAASRSLFGAEGGRPGLPRPAGRSAVLGCGADLERFRPQPVEQARRRLGLDPGGRYLLFPASPDRPVKRYDRAVDLAARTGAELLTLGAVDPGEVPTWINAASAVLVTSDNEGFGLAAVEAIACGAPVLSTPVGIAPHLLDGLAQCHVGPFDGAAWAARAEPLLAEPHRVSQGPLRAEPFGARRMAERAVAAYRDLIEIA